jgi:hypothetical protein
MQPRAQRSCPTVVFGPDASPGSEVVSGQCETTQRAQTRDSMTTRSVVWPGLLGVVMSAAEAGAQLLSPARPVTLHSRILSEDRTVFVAVPESYARGATRYPVVYLTDADWNFAHTQSSAQLLARNRIIPEVIVVGVTNLRDRTRDLYATRADFTHNGRTIRLPRAATPTSSSSSSLVSSYRGSSGRTERPACESWRVIPRAATSRCTRCAQSRSCSRR